MNFEIQLSLTSRYGAFDIMTMLWAGQTKMNFEIQLSLTSWYGAFDIMTMLWAGQTKMNFEIQLPLTSRYGPCCGLDKRKIVFLFPSEVKKFFSFPSVQRNPAAQPGFCSNINSGVSSI